MPPLITVVVPCLDEQDSLPTLRDRLIPVLEGIGSFEVVLVDDGSRDGTLAVMQALHTEDSRIRYMSFSRNFGHEAATSAGLLHARGDWVVLIDADLQDPPEVIPKLLARGLEGFDVVTARRQVREGERLSKRLTSALFYRFFGLFIQDFQLPLDTGDFRIMSRVAVDGFNHMPERNRFVRGMIAWSGYRTAEVAYQREARLAGETKYGPLKLIALAVDAVTSFSTLPLRFATWVGLSVTTFALLAALNMVYQKLFGDLELEGYAYQMVSMFFLGGVQLLILGIIGEYIGRIYDEVKRRPLFLIGSASPDATTAPSPPPPPPASSPV